MAADFSTLPKSSTSSVSAWLNARIGRVALVVVADRLAGMGEEHRVAVAAARLQELDREVLLGDGVGMLGCFCRVPSQRRRPPGAASSP